MGILRDQEMENTLKYEPSRYIDDFHLAGFAYYDGLDVIDELTLGQSVELVREVDNPYDEKAVAIYYKGKKLGYIPASHNSIISTLIYYGYGDIFEARIQMINKENHPERQFRVVVKVKDNR
ncbi:MAG: HIRAN domain-containing protein [Peptoniphilaceae bacterium]|nr:HIRAN domain-containing protein [Peptoniphilaceae bacterium]MDY4196812.1 HIRAN domain-containing protein [Peptoniphilaceae bacterium]MDY5766668.1 HIRAN domain-containing protein [Peptoniphilaceae bacterium]